MDRTVRLDPDAASQPPQPAVSPAVAEAQAERRRLRLAIDTVLVGYGVVFLAGVLAHQIGTGLSHVWDLIT